MAEKNNANIGFEKQIWDAACVLWGHIPAADYRKVIVGLIFLRYISSAFEMRRKQLLDEGEGFEDDPDAYEEENVFFVPENARWSVIASAAHTPEIGTIIDNAMQAIETDNNKLKNVLPKNYGNPDLDKRVLGDVVDLFTNMDMSDTKASQDLLGRTYDYCIGQFAADEGVKGGEFYTPASVVKTIVSVLNPLSNCRVYDPCCGSGGMFVQSAEFIQAHSGRRGSISVYGQESNSDTWKMAKMNLAIRGIDADIGPYHEDTFFHDLHPTLKADYIMANPPFNLKNWGQEKLKNDVRWKYGLPPASNANFAWIQHMLHHLSPKGKIGLVLANTALSIGTGEEFEIRKRIIEDNLVEAVVSLPASLFYSTKIKVSIWFINKRKTTTDVLFIDARNLGHPITRTMKEFSDGDISEIADTIHKFQIDNNIDERIGFCRSATIDEIRSKNYNISPSKYISGSIDAGDVGEYLEQVDGDIEELGTLQTVIGHCNEYARIQADSRGKDFGTLLKTITSLDGCRIHSLLAESSKVSEKKKQLREKIDEMSGRLFKHWFIDFNFNDIYGEPYLINGGELKDTSYGKIPFEWSVSAMGDILTVSNEKVGDRTDIPEYSTTNQGIFPRATKFNKTLSKNSGKNKVIRRGDIVFGMSREIFNFGVMTDPIGSVSPAYHVYHINEEIMNPEFLESYMRICSDYFLSLIKPGAREGQVLDKDELQRKIILLPPLKLQEQFIALKNYSDDWLV